MSRQRALAPLGCSYNDFIHLTNGVHGKRRGWLPRSWLGQEERACCWECLKEDNDALSFFRRQESATLPLSKVKVAVVMSSETLRVEN